MKYPEQNQMSLFKRASDVATLEVFHRIEHKDQYHVWYMIDFKDIGSETKIRIALKKLEKIGFITKIKSYPCFWKREVEKDEK